MGLVPSVGTMLYRGPSSSFFLFPEPSCSRASVLSCPWRQGCVKVGNGCLELIDIGICLVSVHRISSVHGGSIPWVNQVEMSEFNPVDPMPILVDFMTLIIPALLIIILWWDSGVYPSRKMFPSVQNGLFWIFVLSLTSSETLAKLNSSVPQGFFILFLFWFCHVGDQIQGPEHTSWVL
jgi:hypothetical protein